MLLRKWCQMWRSTDNRVATDAGFTLAELVFAAAILFFAGTAILALILGAQRAALVAKEKAALVNAVSSQMEYVRTLSWPKIGTGPSSNPTGTVTTTTTVTGQYNITITPTITWVSDSQAGGAQAYKDVVMVGRAALPNGSGVMTLTGESIVSSYTTHP